MNITFLNENKFLNKNEILNEIFEINKTTQN